MYSLSEAWRDVVALAKLSDDVVNQTIRYSEDPNMAKARNLLDRIDMRRLYVNVADISGSFPKSMFYILSNSTLLKTVENIL